ncbi:hypothetical protein [Streptomyces noursei]|uniref:hypothetical protein n=1 Tax=Streptomyces noursei TaxID=1971 RepID=UPI00167C0324|nr:hypothetical protein [Streptomyces noursei]MCZ1014429.1 hypothetical protein [Streptomyces noursei]GGW94956.1 hypothetical protein GCM10010341_15150 [Streptomyces noursei]
MSTPARPCAELLREVALIACGRREGKTRSCRSCARKAPGLLNIATTGALDTLAAAICGNLSSACQDCRSKAAVIISETSDAPCAA